MQHRKRLMSVASAGNRGSAPRLRCRRRGTALAVAAAALALIAAPAASAEDTTIIYSPTYWTLLAAFPAGWAPNACEATVVLSGTTGVCTSEFAPAYIYPDGTLGMTPWFLDPSSPTRWSIERDPCATDPACLEGF
jgi:hypothetical protein